MSDDSGRLSQAPKADDRSDASVVTQFFLVPLAVVAGLVGVFLLFTLVTQNPPSSEDYMRTLRSGRFNQRWQAAFELSNLLKKTDPSNHDPRLVGELIQVFGESMDSSRQDPRIKRYLALALGNSGSREAVAPLLRAARGDDPECRLYALWGLARLQAPDSEEVFRQGLADSDPSIRSVCAFGLGLLPGASVSAELKALLNDPVPEVRWNAALSLARRGDASGEATLIKLLDRQYLGEFSGLNEADRAEMILNAMRGLNYLKTDGLDEKIRRIASEDPNPAVRTAASGWKESDPQ